QPRQSRVEQLVVPAAMKLDQAEPVAKRVAENGEAPPRIFSDRLFDGGARRGAAADRAGDVVDHEIKVDGSPVASVATLDRAFRSGMGPRLSDDEINRSRRAAKLRPLVLQPAL